MAASQAPKGVTKKLVSDDLAKQLESAGTPVGAEKKKDLMTGAELRKKAKELKSKTKGKKIKSARLEKQQQRALASNKGIESKFTSGKRKNCNICSRNQRAGRECLHSFIPTTL